MDLKSNLSNEVYYIPNAHSKIALVGNPNVGKSAIFNILTGQYVIVSNYPGTTVDYSSGEITLPDSTSCVLIDTPGTNSFMPKSEDESVARLVLWNENINYVIQVADSKNLRRALMLMIELIEMDFPIVLDLNMEDEAMERGINIDIEKLSKLLGDIKIVSTSAITKKGINDLKKALFLFKKINFKIKYNDEIEILCKKLEQAMPLDFKFKRSASLMLILNDNTVLDFFNEKYKKSLQLILNEIDKDKFKEFALSIYNTRNKIIDEILDQVLINKPCQNKYSFSSKLGLLLTHSYYGLIVFIIVMIMLYGFVGVFGAGICVDFIEEQVFESYINPFFKWLFSKISNNKSFVYNLFVGEFGILTMGLTYAIAIVLPIMFTFFLAFSLLEDSGYLPRLTILSDRIFKIIGLNGKAILPLILGFGCGTMAILSTRILDTKKEKIITTLLLALGIPCSAQLGVMLGLSLKISWMAVFIVIITVFLQIIIAGVLANNFIKEKSSLFLIELPPMRIPQFVNIVKKTYYRVIWYLSEVVPIFLIGTFILFILSESGILKLLEYIFSPLISSLLGLPIESTYIFLMGFLRRDYGAAGIYNLYEKGILTPLQVIVLLVIVTLFVPCVASFFMMIKERGVKVALTIFFIITPYSFFIGYILKIFLSIFFPNLNYLSK